MEATPIDLLEDLQLLPEEVIQTFLDNYTPETLQSTLWRIFYLAVKGGIENPNSPITPEEAALLIDQLTNLVTAVFTLHQEGRAYLPAQQEGTGHE